MRRLFFPFSGNSFYLDGEGFHHWVRVNRAQVGDEIEVSDTHGRLVRAKLVQIEEKQGLMEVLEEIQVGSFDNLEVILAFGLLKGEKTDWLIQKAVELGVTAIWPLEMDHSIMKLDAKKALDRQKRWQKIALEAAQQCGGGQVPTVEMPRKLSKAVSEFEGTIWVPHEARPDQSLKKELKSRSKANRNLIIVGPEGGFSASETELLKEAGANLVTLGDRILRAETASLAALTMVLYEWGHLGGQE